MEELDGREVDDRTAQALADLRVPANAEILPDDPPVPVAEVASDLRDTPSGEEVRLWLEWDGDRLAGAAQLLLEHWETNRHLAHADIAVAPDRRRQGLGAALFDAVAAHARERGRRYLFLTPAAGSSYAAFADALGGKVTLEEDLNRLRLADVDRALLERWDRPADGYSLVTIPDRCPDDLLGRFADLRGVMNDAPMPDVVEEMVVTPEEVRAREASDAVGGWERWCLVARHDATGDLVGFTELFLGPHRRWLASQGGTAVRPEHRGHGLGRWLKAANVRRVLDRRPEVTTIDTDNAGTNAAMLAINRALGFRQVLTWAEYQFELSPHGGRSVVMAR